jgi:hypothetical protein
VTLRVFRDTTGLYKQTPHTVSVLKCAETLDARNPPKIGETLKLEYLEHVPKDDQSTMLVAGLYAREKH